MILLIVAYENCFQGLHGMNSIWVGDYESVDSAREDAIAESYEVMNSYDHITDILKDECSNNCEDDSDWDDVYAEIEAENIAYNIYKVQKTEGATALELDKICSVIGIDSFIEKYDCVEVE